jgi:hypothetical protein
MPNRGKDQIRSLGPAIEIIDVCYHKDPPHHRNVDKAGVSSRAALR